MLTKPLNLLAVLVLLVSSVVTAMPAHSIPAQRENFWKQLDGKYIGLMDGKGVEGAWRQYDAFNQARSNVQDSQSPQTGPTLGGASPAGTSGGYTGTQPVQGQSQTKTYAPNPQQRYTTQGGMPNGNPFEDTTAFPYYNITPEFRSGVYPTPPPDPHKAVSPPAFAVAQPAGPLGAAALDALKGVASAGTNHNLRADQAAVQGAVAARVAGDLINNAQTAGNNAKASAAGAAQEAADSMADAFNPTWLQMLVLSRTPLLNVANEATGAACSASQPIKTYENAVYLVQQAYRNVFLPMAVLLLLPGAAMTQMKSLVSSGIMQNQNDEDAISPFTGILRSLIAIFLIPASQLIVSYSIDVGNSLQYEVHRHVNYLNIYMWGDEQVFRAPVENFEKGIKPPSAFQVLGKMSEGAEAQSGTISQSPATIMLQALVNSTADGAAFGLVIMCAFQIALACYLFLMGPVAAALYAWPTGAGSLFIRVFANWTDAIINLSLWRFWWCVVLLCIDTRLGWLGAFDMYSMWEMLMFLAFLIILMYVPFNPFDFKAGEMVSQIMQKADKAVGEATQKG